MPACEDMNEEIARLKAEEKAASLELHRALCARSDMLKIVLYVPTEGRE